MPALEERNQEEKNNVNLKRLMKLESHSRGVEPFFLIFPLMQASVHTLLLLYDCVCVCDYFGLLLLTHSCRVCLTAFCHQIGLAGFSRNCCSHIAAAASDSWISQISVNRKHMMWCVYVWFTPLPTAVIGFHLNAQKNAAWHDWQNRKQT